MAPWWHIVARLLNPFELYVAETMELGCRDIKPL
jgi:hypothetical protein